MFPSQRGCAAAMRQETTDTASEQYRHECEVKYVAKLRNHEARRKYLEGVAKHRPNDARRLRVDAWALIQQASK